LSDSNAGVASAGPINEERAREPGNKSPPTGSRVRKLTKGFEMKRLTSAVAALMLALAVLASSGAFAGSAATADSPHNAGHERHAYDFDRFLKRYEAANTAFVNGNPQPWLTIVADKDPQSIFGGFGGLGEAGIAAVHQRYLLAAGAFRPSGAEVDFEYLVKDVRGKLAYTVALERAQVLYPGRTELAEHFLRSTMVFRFEKGAWKIVHRHADTMVDLQLPTA
jgi:SnoaL-like domain